MGFRLIFLVVAFCLGLVLPAAAQEVVNLPITAPSLGLRANLRSLSVEKPSVVVELPGRGASAAPATITLTAQGQDRVHHYTLLTIANPTASPEEVILALSHRQFPGSGILRPAVFGSAIIHVNLAGDETGIEEVTTPGFDAFRLSFKPNSQLTIALETTPGQVEARLWNRAAFEANNSLRSFFNGVLPGIALLMAVLIIALYGVRAHPVFMAGGAFAFAALLFIALEGGYLPLVQGLTGLPQRFTPQIRAVVESLMAITLLLCLIALSDLRRIRPALGMAGRVVAALLLAIPIYGLIAPDAATAMARIVFVLTAAAGFLLLDIARRESDAVGTGHLVVWGALVVWTFLAAVAALAGRPSVFMSTLLASGLTVVLVAMGFSLAQFAFNQGFLARRYFADAGRRGLALAGARHFIWDWQPLDNDLHVAPELARAQGYANSLFDREAGEIFYELIHPGDREAYITAATALARDGRGHMEQEFRLRRADESYRWFLLRASAIPGAGQRAARLIGTLTDITGAKRDEERLLTGAVYDNLTGLPNRALFIDRLLQELARGHGRAPLHVMVIDINRFKTLNETLGPEAGDSLIMVAARRIAQCLAPGDTLARLSGGQFAVALTTCINGHMAINAAERVAAAMAKPVDIAHREIFPAVNIGVAAARSPAPTPEGLLKEATAALFETLRPGQLNIALFTPSMADERSALMTLESELRRAVERNELEVHYQPLVRLASLDLVGFEALVRWNHPRLGLMAPDSFISLAEQTGLIGGIGRYVLQEAARQLGVWQRTHSVGGPLIMTVNVSSGQLLDPHLAENVSHITRREALSRGTLKLEITESMVMQYPEQAAGLMARLRQMGVGLACDDFGTGHSALANLRDMPFDTLKIDRSFLAPSRDEARSARILDTIVRLGHGLGMTVVAEGIENQEQLEKLAAMGCDLGQGYFLCAPLTARQINVALAELPLRPDATLMAMLWDQNERSGVPAPARPDVVVEAEKLIELPPPEPPAATPAASQPKAGTAPMAPRPAPRQQVILGRIEELPSIFSVAEAEPAAPPAASPAPAAAVPQRKRQTPPRPAVKPARPASKPARPARTAAGRASRAETPTPATAKPGRPPLKLVVVDNEVVAENHPGTGKPTKPRRPRKR
jgi:diguanylate cyclase (GGDEF)-like protein